MHGLPGLLQDAHIIWREVNQGSQQQCMNLICMAVQQPSPQKCCAIWRLDSIQHLMCCCVFATCRAATAPAMAAVAPRGGGRMRLSCSSACSSS